MKPAQMLDQLNQHGMNAGGDYDDNEEVDGWFEWRVTENLLTITFRPQVNGEPGPVHEAYWEINLLAQARMAVTNEQA